MLWKRRVGGDEGKDAYVGFSVEDFRGTLKLWLHFLTVSTPCEKKSREAIPMARRL